MLWMWLAAAMFVSQQTGPGNSLLVFHQGQPVAVVERPAYVLPFGGVPLVDADKLHELIDKLDKRLYHPPLDAKWDGQGRIVPEQSGSRLDRKRLINEVYEFFYAVGPKRLEAPLMVVHPRVDRDLLAYVSAKRIGAYTTYFRSSNKNRMHNIALAVRAIDSHVVLPGETFSFNQVVGERTREKGYKEAPVIVSGELSEGIGGGICQVSSTLFNAVDRAGLHIVQRYSHSRDVPYVPPGRDAAVSWNGPDFRFQNRYPYPILIRAQAWAGGLVVTVHSFEELEYEPRHVPGVSEGVPEEILDDDEDFP